MAPTPHPVSPPEPSSGHISQLDGLRGLAILIVLIYHFAGDIPFNIILIAPVYYGWSGVDLFFVLSGFLITGILLRTRAGADYFRSFYIRRALRIFPLYYSVLALCALVSFAFPAIKSMFPSAHDQVFHWLYLSNWTPLLDSEDQRRMGGFWSLGIEEQFYWIWPVLVWKLRPARLPWVAAGGIAAAVLLRTCIYGHATDPFVYRTTFCRMDALMTGALCALAWRSPAFQDWFRQRIRLAPLAIFALLAVAMAGGTRWHDQFTYRIGFTVFDAAYALLLLYVLQGAGMARAFFNSRSMRSLGKYSYGIYVYHQFLYGGFARLGVAPGLPLLTASLAGTFALSVVSYELMEKRFIGLKSRFPGKPARRIAPVYSPEESPVAL